MAFATGSPYFPQSDNTFDYRTHTQGSVARVTLYSHTHTHTHPEFLSGHSGKGSLVINTVFCSDGDWRE